MSLGKCKFEIWVQFLWEAVMISIIGDVVILAISPIIAETSASYFSERNADLKVRTAGTGKYWYLYRWIYCTGFKNTRCGGSYNERNGSDGYWDDIRYFDYCSISSRNHDNEEKAEADIK